MNETSQRLTKSGTSPTPKQIESWLGKKAYDEATTYHDGKWLLLNINDTMVHADAEMLLAVKRKPKCAND